MHFLMWFSQMGEFSWYILTRCTLVACAMLASALVVLAWATGGGSATAALYSYARHTLLMSAVVLGAGVLGGALMEDIRGR